ncbi:MAG: sigma-70 family RNA polymerase sigma factor [Lachnospiraceae bacterium]|nr:sigma-70 family RNA polymerase sigma factor [Lachnospiraceae bacterium]
MSEKGFHRTPEAVVEMYGDMVYKIALSQMKNKEDAEDVFQEVFLNYMNCKKDFLSEEHEKAYIIRMVVNCCKKHFTSAWFRHRADLTDLSEIAEAATMNDEERDLYEAVLALPVKYKLVIHLFYYEEMSISEISQALHMKENTVKSQLMRGRKMLKEALVGGAYNAG